MDTYKLYKISKFFYRYKMSIIAKIFKGVNYIIHSCSIPYQTQIGEKCKFLYGGLGTVVSKDSIIGNEVIIGTNVLIGGRSNNPEHPKIGNRVYIATGAKILGNIRIGDNVIIGANSVVITDVPDNCSVAGVPARVIKSNINIEEFCSIDRLINKK